jgi:hypothetical protein
MYQIHRTLDAYDYYCVTDVQSENIEDSDALVNDVVIFLKGSVVYCVYQAHVCKLHCNFE